jgi:hypothetical protein
MQKRSHYWRETGEANTTEMVNCRPTIKGRKE